MIYINSSTVYVPKGSISQAGNSIRFINGMTKEVHNVSIDSSTEFSYKVNTYGMPLTNGQYVYEVYLDNSVYDSGIA